ncbi:MULTISPECIES: hypothetical protein [Sporomusa]|uniref:5'-methylthioadenosine/S-adenosylhomocysteine nucleosidase family protein n=1 Tax=Sporomusa TaxID=2375 RepID=UPI00166758D3|nr:MULTISPECIES: hypothetical protein [Sporomusa]MCM0759084.1 hypothetical protein [Sporomusa sphaeroides DSM 2875]
MLADDKVIQEYIFNSCAKSLLLKCFTDFMLGNRIGGVTQVTHALSIDDYRDIATSGYLFWQDGSWYEHFSKSIRRLQGRELKHYSPFLHDYAALLGITLGVKKLNNIELTMWLSVLLKEAEDATQDSWVKDFIKALGYVAQNRENEYLIFIQNKIDPIIEDHALAIWLARFSGSSRDLELRASTFLRMLKTDYYPKQVNYFLDILIITAYYKVPVSSPVAVTNLNTGGGSKLTKKILFVGSDFDMNTNEYFHIKGLGKPEIIKELAADALYDYDFVIIHPKSFSHFIFGRPTESSGSSKELYELKGQNNDWDLDTVFDEAERTKELEIAIAKGTVVIFLAVSENIQKFFGYRTNYKGYIKTNIGSFLQNTEFKMKRTRKVTGVDQTGMFSDYFNVLSENGLLNVWNNEFTTALSLAETPDGYSLGQEISIDGKQAWLLSPPNSKEAMDALIKCLDTSFNSNSTKKIAAKSGFKAVANEVLQSLVGSANLLLVTATDLETKILHDIIEPLDNYNQKLKGYNQNQTYYIGKFGAYPTIHVRCAMGSGGRDASMMTVSEAIRFWKPKAIVMVGIAFGINPTKQNLGDVVVADKVTFYEPSRVGQDASLNRDTKYNADVVLLDRFRNIQGWEFKISEDAYSEKHIGELLSGEKLIDSQEFKDKLLKAFPNAKGGEMEGAGLCAVADRERVPWIIVKGICDWGDGTKKDDFQEVACKAAISLCLAVFEDPYALADLLCIKG